MFDLKLNLTGITSVPGAILILLIFKHRGMSSYKNSIVFIVKVGTVSLTRIQQCFVKWKQRNIPLQFGKKN